MTDQTSPTRILIGMALFIAFVMFGIPWLVEIAEMNAAFAHRVVSGSCR